MVARLTVAAEAPKLAWVPEWTSPAANRLFLPAGSNPIECCPAVSMVTAEDADTGSGGTSTKSPAHQPDICNVSHLDSTNSSFG